MGRGSFRFRLAGVVVLIAAAGGVWWLASASRARTAGSDRAPARDAPVSPIRAEGNAATVSRAVAPRAATPPASAPQVPAGDGPAEGEQMPGSWEGVDLDEVRKALPDNLYWQLAAPTQDPKLLEWRDAEHDRWNVEYGKVLSGTGTEDEVRAYYDHRARVSGDYVEFATYLLDHYGGQLPEQDVGLLKLARQLHLARLEEIPRKVEEALDHQRAQAAARAAWLADQAQFDAGDSDSQ